MNRRSFIAASAFGLGLPLATRSAVADALEQHRGPVAESDPATSGPDLSANQIVTHVEAFYDKIVTFKASFEQRVALELPNKNRDVGGSVFFEQPGKMSWRYTCSGNRVLSDGQRIQIYQRESKQLFDQGFEMSEYPAALSFLIAHGQLEQTFELSKFSSNSLNLARTHTLLGVPRHRSTAYARLLFYVDVRTYEVRRVLVIDAYGNRNRFDFFRSTLNPRIPLNEFAFSAPLGTQIIRL